MPFKEFKKTEPKISYKMNKSVMNLSDKSYLEHFLVVGNFFFSKLASL